MMAGAAAVTILTRDQVDRTRSMAVQLGPHALPLVEALSAGIITLALPQRHHRAPLATMRRCDRPVILLVGDDDYASTGPDGWRCAHQAVRWARTALVHASGGQRQHYAAAVEAAVVAGRFLLVETAARFAPAWAELLGTTPTMFIVPHDGVHPRPVAAGAIQ